jgi:selenocysteine lyase/cysteine desulfurase
MNVDEARARFPVLERFAHLNAGSLGPWSHATFEAMAERSRFDHAHGRGGRAWLESMLALRARIRARLAELINSSPEQLALTGSTTDGCNVVLAGLKLEPGDEIVTTDAEHPGQ